MKSDQFCLCIYYGIQLWIIANLVFLENEKLTIIIISCVCNTSEWLKIKVGWKVKSNAELCMIHVCFNSCEPWIFDFNSCELCVTLPFLTLLDLDRCPSIIYYKSWYKSIKIIQICDTVGPSVVLRPSLRETKSRLPRSCCCCNAKSSWLNSEIKTVFIELSILFESSVLPENTLIRQNMAE